ncbi:MAG: hypothetical protein HW411_430 [Gammaproteobacteria bacterium]|nr:hypothetical protein [Gammaproteobacteria bacterium]
MSKKTTLTPIAAALGTTFVVSLAASPIVNAAENPFALNELSSGYMVAEEGKCGDKMEGEGKCGEAMESEAMESEEMESEEMESEEKKAEGKCGEAKCGDAK